jgi:hypothetical protein
MPNRIADSALRRVPRLTAFMILQGRLKLSAAVRRL